MRLHLVRGAVRHQLPVDPGLQHEPLAGVVRPELRWRELHAPHVEELTDRERIGLHGLLVDHTAGVVGMKRSQVLAVDVDADLGRHREALPVHVHAQLRVDVVELVALVGQAHRGDPLLKVRVLRRPGAGRDLKPGPRAGAELRVRGPGRGHDHGDHGDHHDDRRDPADQEQPLLPRGGGLSLLLARKSLLAKSLLLLLTAGHLPPRCSTSTRPPSAPRARRPQPR